MKSAYSKIYIVPTDLLWTRERKFFVKGVGWLKLPQVSQEDYALRIEVVLNPEELFMDIVEVITNDYVGKTYFNPDWNSEISILKFSRGV